MSLAFVKLARCSLTTIHQFANLEKRLIDSPSLEVNFPNSQNILGFTSCTFQTIRLVVAFSKMAVHISLAVFNMQSTVDYSYNVSPAAQLLQ
ncbi:hypothetical protein Tco_0848555 [Tanacetum coccineum]